MKKSEKKSFAMQMLEYLPLYLFWIIVAMILLSLSSCLCIVPGTNTTLGCLPAGYSLYYLPQDQQTDEEQEQGNKETIFLNR